MKKPSVCYIILISVGFISGILNSSCTSSPELVGELDTVCYDKQILPILQRSCAISGCHNSISAEEGFDATNYTSVLSKVTPDDARSSELYKVITSLRGESMMPPDRPLTKEQRMLIEVWIEQGALETKCLDDTTTPPVSYDDSVCFKQSVLPVFLSGCALSSCHDATTQKEGYRLTDYNSIMNSGDGIVPFNASATKLYQVMTISGEDRMPPAPSPALSAEKIAAVRTWINQGAINSDCPDLQCDTLNTIVYSSQVWPVINTNCTGCHNASAHSGNVNLNSYAQIVFYASQFRNNLPVLSGVLNHKQGFAAMPPYGELPYCSIRSIDKWIAEGKLNN